jgi:hypothetical protein
LSVACEQGKRRGPRDRGLCAICDQIVERLLCTGSVLDPRMKRLSEMLKAD